MDRTRIIICILCLWTQFSNGQTNAFGKTIWDWDKSPSTRSGTFTTSQPKSQWTQIRLILTGQNWLGLYPDDRSKGPLGPAASGTVPRTNTNTNLVNINRTGQTLSVSIDGVKRFTTGSAYTNLIGQIKSCVFVTEGYAATAVVDNFKYNGPVNNFTATNSPDWKFYYEIQPVGMPPGSQPVGTPTPARWNAVAQAISGGIQGGAMRIGPCGIASDSMGEVLAQFTRTLTGDFDMTFDFVKTQAGGEFFIYFMTAPASGSSNPRPGGNRSGLISSRPAFVTTLRRKFNPKTGKVEVIKNGVYTHRGYNNLLNGGHLNRRLFLRRYR